MPTQEFKILVLESVPFPTRGRIPLTADPVAPLHIPIQVTHPEAGRPGHVLAQEHGQGLATQPPDQGHAHHQGIPSRHGPEVGADLPDALVVIITILLLFLPHMHGFVVEKRIAHELKR